MGIPDHVSLDDLRDEQRRLRRVRVIVDFTSSVLAQSTMSRTEGEELVAAARERILELFPGRDETYEILYARRFARLLDSCTVPDSSPSAARVLPFRRLNRPPDCRTNTGSDRRLTVAVRPRYSGGRVRWLSLPGDIAFRKIRPNQNGPVRRLIGQQTGFAGPAERSEFRKALPMSDLAEGSRWGGAG